MSEKRTFSDMFFLIVLMIEFIFVMTKFMISGPLGPGRVRVSELSLKNISEKMCFLLIFLIFIFF